MGRAPKRYHPVTGEMIFSEAEEAWLEAMVDGATVPQACEASGIPLNRGQKWQTGTDRPEMRQELERRLARIRDLNEELREKATRERANEQAVSRSNIIDQTLHFLEMAKSDFNVQGGMKCVELLAKLGGHLVQKTELTGKDGGPISLDVEAEFDFSDWPPEKLEQWARLNLELAGEDPENFPA